MDSLANKSANRKAPLARVLLAVSGLLGALSLYQVAASLETSRAAEATLTRVLAAKERVDADVQSQVAQARSAADELKKKNLFNPAAPPSHPVREVVGILGNEALIHGKWYKAGDRVGDAVIVAVEPTKVRVKWNGRETEFLPIQSAGVGGPSPEGPSSAPVRSGGGPSGSPRTVRVKAMPAGAAMGRGGPSPEEMAQLMEKMRNASPEERQRLQEEMRQRYSAEGQ